MMILGLEFSSLRRSVAVVRGDELLAQAVEDAGKKSGLALVEETLRAAGITPADVERLAIGLGPGSYAGVRSAIAVAQGGQLGRSTAVVGVGTMEVLAETARSDGMRGVVTLVVDAQRNEVYRASYKLGDDQAESLEPLKIIPAADLQSIGVVAGPEAARLNPAARGIYPTAEQLARLASKREPVPAESLEPVYLREATFAKAPPARHY